MNPVTLAVTAEPSAEDLAVIGNGLAAFNEADVGPANRVPLAVTLRQGGRVVGGVSGYTAWGWLYVQWLWLDQPQRGRRLAAQLLDAAEAEARQRGCHGAYIDTFNPIALKLYQRLDYVAFGQLDDFPKGRVRTFLQKPL